MSRAIGMIEFKTVCAGITATDIMVKTSEVDIIEAQTVCPGKYIAIVTGDLSAVKPPTIRTEKRVSTVSCSAIPIRRFSPR